MMQSIIPEATRIAMEVAARDRLDRLETLTKEERTAALAFLACCDGDTFDEIVDQVTADGEDDDPATWKPAAPYCMLGGCNLGIFAGDPDSQHFTGDPDSAGPFKVFEADHEPFVAWKTHGGDATAA